MGRGNQLVRQLKLLRFLSKNSLVKRKTRIPELVDYLDCSRRTVYRDLEHLQAAGFALSGDAEGGYRNGITLIQPLDFSTRELRFGDVVALYLARELVGGLEWAAENSFLNDLIEELHDSLEAPLKKQVDQVKSLITVYGPAKRKHLGGEDVPARIFRALGEQRCASILYYTASRGSKDWRVIHPYRETWTSSAQYIEAYCEKAKAMRTFALNRIEEVELLARHFDKLPEYEDYSNDGGFIIFDDKPQRIRLRFAKEKSFHATERDWGKNQATKPLADGRVEVSFDASGLEQVCGFVLRWGGAVEVVEPLALRTLVYEASRRCTSLNSPA